MATAQIQLEVGVNGILVIIDLLIGGSPCQVLTLQVSNFFDDPRSARFFVAVDILNHIRSLNPDVKFPIGKREDGRASIWRLSLNNWVLSLA